MGGILRADTDELFVLDADVGHAIGAERLHLEFELAVLGPAGPVQAAEDDEGWARVNEVRQQIGNQASFDQRNYGYATLTKLLAATDLFELIDEGTSHVSVREKPVRRGKG